MIDYLFVGAYPVDPDSPVGTFRILYGDFIGEPMVPPVDGKANYRELSDAEIVVYLRQGGDSVARGIGTYCLALAGKAAAEAKVIKDFDLQVDLRKQAEEYRAVAQMWFDRADDDEIRAGIGDIFEFAPDDGDFIGEGSLDQLGRAYGWERWSI